MDPRARIHPDATALVDRCVKEFINMVTVQAEEERGMDGKKKMTGLHVIKAFDILGYSNYVGPLTEHLRRYREVTGYVGVRRSNKRATAQRQAATGQMAPQPSDTALGPPPAGITVQGELPAAAVTTGGGGDGTTAVRLYIGCIAAGRCHGARSGVGGHCDAATGRLNQQHHGCSALHCVSGALSGVALASSSRMPPACDDE
ncbi:Nuclear transcription factor Y subunit B-6 [Triticum urartu]|uniref:Nuclear transcription factor Y subunit B-6 n=1 Tax=Triticum urartu TaxID=4572 RepID=M7ZKT0_TRIUA|nr:Nuclear transcription factor Y subunit B-6 [Triticum urartu]